MYRPIAVLLFCGLAGSAETAAIDDRLGPLKEFFRRKGAPVGHLAQEFLAAADRHRLDWRLLPSLAIVETGGGRVGRGNNLFGWGRVRFPTIVDGIQTVARMVAEGPAYRGKSLNEKLRTYSPVPGYLEKVHRTMRQLGALKQRGE